MKRKLLSIIAIAAFAMTSCKKNEPVNQLGDATISGKVTADLDLSNDVNGAGSYQKGFNPDTKAGIDVYCTVDTKNWDQKPDPSYTYAIKTYHTTTDASGNYTFTIPATDKAYNVSITVGEFVQDQVQYSADGNHGAVSTRFSYGTLVRSIFSGANVNGDIKMNDTPATGTTSDVFGNYKLSGRLYYNINLTNDTPVMTYDPIPAGYQIQFVYNTNIPGGGTLTTYATVNTDGTYMIDLPTASINPATVSSVTANFPDIVSTITFDPGSGVTTDAKIWQINSFTFNVNHNNASIEDRWFF